MHNWSGSWACHGAATTLTDYRAVTGGVAALSANTTGTVTNSPTPIEMKKRQRNPAKQLTKRTLFNRLHINFSATDSFRFLLNLLSVPREVFFVVVRFSIMR